MTILSSLFYLSCKPIPPKPIALIFVLDILIYGAGNKFKAGASDEQLA
jgi:hypothetical protein